LKKICYFFFNYFLGKTVDETHEGAENHCCRWRNCDGNSRHYGQDRLDGRSVRLIRLTPRSRRRRRRRRRINAIPHQQRAFWIQRYIKKKVKLSL
jgi:hypothetical protein